MSKRAVDAVFRALFLLTDLRALLRSTAPSHTLNTNQKKEVENIVEKLKQQLNIIEEEIR